MNARHFEIFLTMMISRNLAEAAERLGVSQSAVSKTLHLLERDIGTALFKRVKGRLRPTPDALRLLPYVQRAVSQLETAQRVAQGLRKGAAGHVTIAAAAPALTWLVPSAVGAFLDAWPEIDVEVKAQGTREILTAVSNQEVDLGLALTPADDMDLRVMELCEIREVCRNAIVVVMPQGHPLEKLHFVRPVDLSSQSIVSLPEDTPTATLVAAAFRQAGVPYSPTVIASNAFAVCGLVQHGVGVGLVNPLMLLESTFPRLAVRPFRPRVTVSVCLYTSRFHPLSQPAQHLVGIIEKASQASEVAGLA